jgi:hypothetical protein
MDTADIADFFGADRPLTKKLRRYLRKQAFERSRVFSYRSYLLISLLARIPVWDRVPLLKRLREFSNKAVLYMVQTHMLQKLFIDDPSWERRLVEA